MTRRCASADGRRPSGARAAAGHALMMPPSGGLDNLQILDCSVLLQSDCVFRAGRYDTGRRCDCGLPMRHEKLFEPVDSAEPCGPDLDEIGDEDYLNYVLPAEDRLPARFTDGQFFGATSMDPFDRNAIDLKAEVKTIAGLLERSRDLRLLTLEARFQIAAGQLAGFAESIQAMAGLVAQYWETVHPLGFDGDFTLRQNTLAALDDRAKIILPLQFATIVRDKRLGVLTYRHYAVASGEVQARGPTRLRSPRRRSSRRWRRRRTGPAVEADHATLTPCVRRAGQDPRRLRRRRRLRLCAELRRHCRGAGQDRRADREGHPEACRGVAAGTGDRQRRSGDRRRRVERRGRRAGRRRPCARLPNQPAVAISRASRKPPPRCWPRRPIFPPRSRPRRPSSWSARRGS